MKLKIQAQYLEPGDVVGSGEKVVKASSGLSTSRGKVDVMLEKGDYHRMAEWGKYTMININRPGKFNV